MGELISVDTAHIMPSQDYLKESTIKYILQCINDNELDKLPPTPIVRPAEREREYIAIDGHNLIAVYDYLGKPCRVYVAYSKEDKLPGDSESIETRNKELNDKYNPALTTSKELKSFKHLRQQYAVIADSAN